MVGEICLRALAEFSVRFRWWSWRILGFLKELGRSNGELLLPLLEVIEQEAQMSSWETNDSNTRLIATMGIVRMLTEADLLAHL